MTRCILLWMVCKPWWKNELFWEILDIQECLWKVAPLLEMYVCSLASFGLWRALFPKNDPAQALHSCAALWDPEMLLFQQSPILTWLGDLIVHLEEKCIHISTTAHHDRFVVLISFVIDLTVLFMYSAEYKEWGEHRIEEETCCLPGNRHSEAILVEKNVPTPRSYFDWEKHF